MNNLLKHARWKMRGIINLKYFRWEFSNNKVFIKLNNSKCNLRIIKHTYFPEKKLKLYFLKFLWCFKNRIINSKSCIKHSYEYYTQI